MNTIDGLNIGLIIYTLETNTMIEYTNEFLNYEEGISNCCGARVIEHSERCDDCQENCQVVEE